MSAGRSRGAAHRVRLSDAASGLAAACRAGRGACGHPLALARARALCLGPRQRAGLLADADCRCSDCVGSSGGPVLAHRRLSPAWRCWRWSLPSGKWGSLAALIVFAPRPLYWCIWRPRRPGIEPARRSAACRAPDVGTGDVPYLGVGALVSLVELAAGRASSMTTFLKFVHLATIAALVRRIDRPAVSVLAAPAASQTGAGA